MKNPPQLTPEQKKIVKNWRPVTPRNNPKFNWGKRPSMVLGTPIENGCFCVVAVDCGRKILPIYAEPE